MRAPLVFLFPFIQETLNAFKNVRPPFDFSLSLSLSLLSFIILSFHLSTYAYRLCRLRLQTERLLGNVAIKKKKGENGNGRVSIDSFYAVFV